MLRLDPMTQPEYERYLEVALEDYAQAHFRNGDCDIEEARERSRGGYKSLLPEGIATQNHFLFTVREEGTADPVGLLWLALMEREGRPFIYIYDIEIVESRRSQGLGSALLGLAEDFARGIGVLRVSLNVMGWNTRARALYERHGFGVTGIGMSKRLDVTPS